MYKYLAYSRSSTNVFSSHFLLLLPREPVVMPNFFLVAGYILHPALSTTHFLAAPQAQRLSGPAPPILDACCLMPRPLAGSCPDMPDLGWGAQGKNWTSETPDQALLLTLASRQITLFLSLN